MQISDLVEELLAEAEKAVEFAPAEVSDEQTDDIQLNISYSARGKPCPSWGSNGTWCSLLVLGYLQFGNKLWLGHSIRTLPCGWPGSRVTGVPCGFPGESASDCNVGDVYKGHLCLRCSTRSIDVLDFENVQYWTIQKINIFGNVDVTSMSVYSSGDIQEDDDILRVCWAQIWWMCDGGW